MDRNRTLFSKLAKIVLILLGLGGLVMLFGFGYANLTLDYLRSKGVYPSAEEGMWALIEHSYTQPDQVEIIYAGTNSFDSSDPHVWYVIACIWGGTRANGDPVGSERHVYDQPGTFFLAARDGWAWAPEGFFPTFLGFWMRVYGLAGPGSATPSHDWGSAPQHCEF
jgi:hypothetical protein